MRIIHKVLLANAAVIVPVIVLAGVLAYRGVERGFLTYVRDLELSRLHAAEGRLARAYGRDGGWEGVRAHPERWGELMRREEDDARERPRAASAPPFPRDDSRPPPSRNSRPPPPRDDSRPPPPRDDSPPPPPPREGAPNHDPLEIPPRAVLFDAARHRVMGADVDASEVPLVPIRWQGQTVGYLGLRPIDRLARELDLDYLEGLRIGLITMTMIGLVLAILGSLVLARHVLAPVRKLTEGAARLRAGDFAVTIDVASNDELGVLARDFNSLAKTLGEARRLERSWLAEASHELRTPLAVLRAFVEALEDGVRAPTPETFASMRGQVATLTRLVDDVHELARLDARGPAITLARTEPIAVLRRVLDDFEMRFAERALVVELVPTPEVVAMNADEARLTQLFTNLFENTCRYTDPGGRVRVTVLVEPGKLRLVLDDGPPGVSSAHLTKIFAPFHREDAPRARAHGGSGLGLTICARIVEAHGGTIDAQPSALGGLRVEIVFPTC